VPGLARNRTNFGELNGLMMTENEPNYPRSDDPSNEGEGFDFVHSDEKLNADAAHIAALEAELSQMRDRWMRSEAEIANVNARAKREVDETRRYATQKFASDVVEAAENLHRGLESLPPISAAEPEVIVRLRDGLAAIERGFVGLLERNGIKKEDPTGSEFDPNFHQAMAEQESAKYLPGTVLLARTPTWTLNGRLLRPAMVVVAKAPGSDASALSL